jgi:hypothetical protein
VEERPITEDLSGPRPWRVRWRDPKKARAWGWEAALGAGPFEVVGVVDQSALGLPACLVLRTELGTHEVCEVWLKPDD